MYSIMLLKIHWNVIRKCFPISHSRCQSYSQVNLNNPIAKIRNVGVVAHIDAGNQPFVSFCHECVLLLTI